MGIEDQALALVREQIGGIVLGTVFLFIGLAACAIASIRGRSGVRILVLFGIFSALYGLRILAQNDATFGLLPRSTLGSRPYVISILTYVILIPALLFWYETSLGKLRLFVKAAIAAAAVVATGGIADALLARSPAGLMRYNDILVICFLLPLATATAVPSLARKYVAIPSRVSGIGALVFAAAALYANVKDLLHLPAYPFLEPLAFAVFVSSLGYVAAQRIFAAERRLLSIESELAVAREIQRSILPSGHPDFQSLRVSAAYSPMTAVAGDFYEFIPVDRSRTGFLIADVSGHGVPAALVASMIKVAMQSVASSAHEPQAVLRGLNRILTSQLRGQLVSAAYLWVDTDAGTASYSAAGHPPLLRWRGGALERIECNGLLFGVLAGADYPVCEMPLSIGDRFLLYTDGVTEPENAQGDAFGDHRLEQVVRDHQSRPSAELSSQLLREIQDWQPPSTTQQDDITLLVIDVV